MPNTEDQKQKVVTRFPPSPTGPLHVGNVRTALFNYFFARQKGGEFIVRVEDTDKARSKKEYELGMLESLKWLGLTRDGELWHQTERLPIHKKYLDKLIESGHAYISHETEGENKEVVRFRNPNKVITFTDLIRGEITIDTTEVGDFIIARNINDPVYHLAVVVDDFEAGITHVIRGEDHISNTPRHILIQDAIGAPRPIYAHLPLMLAPDKSKLSKRKHGESVSLDFYREKGYLPEAVVNFLALLGWNPGTDQEIFSLQELIDAFDFSKVQKSGAIFNIEKLNWLNKEYMKRMPADELEAKVAEFISKSGHFQDKGWKLDEELLEKLLPIISERISVFSEITAMAEAGELDYFFEPPEYDPAKLIWKDSTKEKTAENIKKVINILSSVGEGEWGSETIKSAVWPFAEEQGRGSVLWPMRYSLSGREKSPDPFILAGALGKAETLKRLTNAEEKAS